MNDTASFKDDDTASTTWSALKYRTFRFFWIAIFFAHVGSTMQSVSAGWLMAVLSSSPFLVSLVQGSFSISIFLLVVPAGVAGDILNRRWLITGALLVMMVSAACVGVLVLTQDITPYPLLVLTFMFGLAGAIISPTLQALIPDLVSRRQLPSAITLGSIGSSTARAVGPAIAGLLIGLVGEGATFIINAFTFMGLCLVILLWRDRREEQPRPKTSFIEALTMGLRFAKKSWFFRALLVRGASSFFFMSALLALLPMVVIESLNGDAKDLGLLMSSFGIGAVVSALLLSRLYKRLSRHAVVNVGNIVHALALLAVVSTGDIFVAAIAMVFAGAAWTITMTSLNISFQMILPQWIRARGLAISMMSITGSVGVGSAVWGQVAEQTSLAQAFVLAAVGGIFAGGLSNHYFVADEVSEQSLDGPTVGDGNPVEAHGPLRTK